MNCAAFSMVVPLLVTVVQLLPKFVVRLIAGFGPPLTEPTTSAVLSLNRAMLFRFVPVLEFWSTQPAMELTGGAADPSSEAAAKDVPTIATLSIIAIASKVRIVAPGSPPFRVNLAVSTACPGMSTD